MKRNIKYWALFIIIILLVVGFKVQANNNDPMACTMDAKLCPDGVTYVGRSGPKCEFQACPGENEREEVKNRLENFKKERELNKEENKIKRDEFKNEKEGLKEDFKNQKEQQKNKIESMIQSVKTEREKFKAEFELKKEEVKTKVEEIKTKLKEDLTKIKDEKKRISSEKILEAIQKLNIKLTDNLSEKVDKIENVLVGIQSRISKAEERGLDVIKVKTEVEKAKIAITKAREAISAQALKVYSVNITTESNLRAEMKKLRDLFRADMKIVYEKVKLAHMAVRDTATTLAQIPQIDDDSKIINEEDSTKVEDNSEKTKTN